MAKKKEIKEKDKKQNQPAREVGFFREYFELISEVLVFVFFIQAFLLQTYAIPTPSMEDNMLIGDHLIVDKVKFSKNLTFADKMLLPQKPVERGDIVVFKAPPEIKDKNLEKLEYVKRVIGLPGDVIRVKDKKVYINDQKLDEPYVFFKDNISFLDHFPSEYSTFWLMQFPNEFKGNTVETPYGKGFKVPADHYFCMGDNRNHSSDSRVWGPVHKDFIMGSPWRIYWSFESKTSEILTNSVSQKIVNLFKTIVNFFSKTRWDRTFKKYQSATYQ
jgi:signal peptidase I